MFSSSNKLEIILENTSPYYYAGHQPKPRNTSLCLQPTHQASLPSHLSTSARSRLVEKMPATNQWPAVSWESLFGIPVAQSLACSTHYSAAVYWWYRISSFAWFLARVMPLFPPPQQPGCSATPLNPGGPSWCCQQGARENHFLNTELETLLECCPQSLDCASALEPVEIYIEFCLFIHIH